MLSPYAEPVSYTHLPFGQKTEPEYRMEIESIFDTIDNVLVQDVNYNLKYACGDVVDSLQKISASFFDAKNKLILEQTAEALSLIHI